MARKRNRRGRGAGVLPEAALPSRGVPRRLRVERDLHQQLDAALRNLRDNRVSRAIITRVELTGDIAFARVYVRSPLETEVSPDALIKTLMLASSRLRREIGNTMALRKAPELRFIYDSGVEARERVEELLAEIRSEDPTDSAEGADSDEGADSGDATGPVDSTEPADSGDATDPVDSTEPADPVDATEPTAPSQPTELAEPPEPR